MGFLSAFAGTVRVELPSPSGEGPYWVDLKAALPGADLDVAEGKRIQISATGTGNAAKAAGAAEAARLRNRAARRKLLPEGDPQEEAPEQETAVQTAVTVDQAAYRLELLMLAVTDWNLTDEHDQVLPLSPASAKRRSLTRLPSGPYNVLVETVEGQIAEQGQERDAEAEADFRQ